MAGFRSLRVGALDHFNELLGGRETGATGQTIDLHPEGYERYEVDEAEFRVGTARGS
jgi:hypothetical protein